MLSSPFRLSQHIPQEILGALPLWMVKNDLLTGRLRQILPEQAFFAPTLYAVYTSRKYLTPKVRSLIDFLVEKLVDLPQKL